MRGPLLFVVALAVGAGIGAIAGALPIPHEEVAAPPASTRGPVAPESEPPAGPRATRVPFHLEETLSEGAAACAVTDGVCLAPFGAGARAFPIAPAAQVDALVVTLSWRPSSPLTQSLHMDLVACIDGCADGRFVLLDEKEGPSPLALEGDGFDASPDDMLVLLVRAPDAMPGPGAVRAHPRQDFVLDGFVEVLAGE